MICRNTFSFFFFFLQLRIQIIKKKIQLKKENEKVSLENVSNLQSIKAL